MPRMRDEKQDGIIGEARALFDRMAGEAKRQAHRDQEAARRGGPATKALFATCLVAAALAVATLIYGFIQFPDAPIRQTAGGYVGKHGAPYTRAHYDKFKLWEKVIFASFALTFLTGFGAVVAEKLNRRKRRS